jgi:cytochrome c-type biogenesis protein CcmE
MKKTHIAIIVIVAVAIAALIAIMGKGDEYANFAKAAQNPDTEYHVVGKCDKSKPVEYNPVVNTDEFVFYMIDTDSSKTERKVVLHKSKPQDFDHAEQIVIVGKMQGNEFHANDILMKCPSKYNDGKPVETKG